MTLPRPLILFLAFCGGAAFFGLPLVLGAAILTAPEPTAGINNHHGHDHPAAISALDAPLGEIAIDAVDVGFEPTQIEVEAPGVYVVTYTNTGAVPHDLVFDDGTATPVTDGGDSIAVQVTVPEDGIGFVCGVPGHADAGMRGSITIAGQRRGGETARTDSQPVEPNLDAPQYVVRYPHAPARLDGEVHDIELVMTERPMTVADGYEQVVWTFGDEVPGPVIRVKVGDTIRVTLKNPKTNQMAHSIDFHASLVAWNDEMRSIAPGEELVYEFEAKYAGVYMYHCGTAPALHHIANGMYGMIIVEPEEGLPPADHEFALVQSEWYLGQQGQVTDLAKASEGAPNPEFVVFNGVANQYLDNPIQVGVGQTVRVFILNAGPSVDSSFHVVGTIFHQVFKEGVRLDEGNPGNWGSQAVDLAPAQGAIVDMRFDEDGLYPIVTHAFNFVGKGALGLFQAGDGGDASGEH